MSEQRSFMQELDLWSDANVVGPLSSADPNHQEWPAVVEQVKKAIRQKVLDTLGDETVIEVVLGLVYNERRVRLQQ